MSIAASTIDYLREHDLLLTTADSCIAGKIIKLLSEVEGSGELIERGYVVYSVNAKQRLLHVSFDAIEKFNLTSCEGFVQGGAVSGSSTTPLSPGAFESSGSQSLAQCWSCAWIVPCLKPWFEPVARRSIFFQEFSTAIKRRWQTLPLKVASRLELPIRSLRSEKSHARRTTIFNGECHCFYAGFFLWGKQPVLFQEQKPHGSTGNQHLHCNEK